MIYTVWGIPFGVDHDVKLLVDAPDLNAAVHDVIELHQGDFALSGAFIDTDWFPLQTISAEPLPQGVLR